MSFPAASLVQSLADSAAASPRGVFCPCGAQAHGSGDSSPTDRGTPAPRIRGLQPHGSGDSSPTQGGDVAGAGAMFLCCVLLAAAGGLRLCCGIELLKGLKGQSLSFPALQPGEVPDIARVTWRSRGSHIAEAKPRAKMFSVDYLPKFHGRLLIHPTNLSLEISPLKPGDGGRYEVVVDTLSDPTNPKTFSYLLLLHGGSPETVAGTGDTGGHSGSTAAPWGATEARAGDTPIPGAGGGQPPGEGGGPEVCGVRDRYCVVKAYLVATIFGPLLILVAAVHVVTRDKATEPGDEVSAGLRVGSEPPGFTAPLGPSPWQR